MANPEHVALVRKGAEAIAEWRQAHPDARFDLSAVDLSGANLRDADLWGADLGGANLSAAGLTGADLSEARLRGANLGGANLTGAILSEANLGWANLSGANFSGANLSDADLSGANLIMADFTGANLIRANLIMADLTGVNLAAADLSVARAIGANLTDANLAGANLYRTDLSEARLGGADLSRARLGFTHLGSIDLSGVTGLPNVLHQFPSTVGVDTLMASFRGAGKKPTPELMTFFRGAGVPQELLNALPKIVSDIKYYSCFISYGQPDLEFAKKLCEDLKAKDVDCWFYPHDKTVGEDTWRDIAAGRRAAEKMIVVCSIAALIRDGVLKEIEDQIDEDSDKLMPISLDRLWEERGFKVQRGDRDLKPPLIIKNRPNFSGWDSEPARYQKGLEDLLKGLERP